MWLGGTGRVRLHRAVGRAAQRLVQRSRPCALLSLSILELIPQGLFGRIWGKDTRPAATHGVWTGLLRQSCWAGDWYLGSLHQGTALRSSGRGAGSMWDQFEVTILFPCCSDTHVTCYKDLGVTYRGTWSVTESGSECLNWNISALAQKKYNGRRADAAHLGLSNHNYCR